MRECGDRVERRGEEKRVESVITLEVVCHDNGMYLA